LFENGAKKTEERFLPKSEPILALQRTIIAAERNPNGNGDPYPPFSMIGIFGFSIYKFFSNTYPKKLPPVYQSVPPSAAQSGHEPYLHWAHYWALSCRSLGSTGTFLNENWSISDAACIHLLRG